MKIETQPREDHQVRVVAEFETIELEKFRQRAARKISQETKIPGFRPGKAPYNVIRRMAGDEAITERAVELMVDDVYPKVLNEADLHPTYPGSLEEVLAIDPPKFAFLIPLPPSVELGDYRAVRKEYAPEPVSDDEVDAFIKRLQTSYSTAEPVERAAEKGDLVAVKVTGTLTRPEEGEDAELIKETPYQVVIGDTALSPDNWPYEGFSSELVGLAANDEKDVNYTYPEEHDSEKLRGKEIVIHVVVQTVKAIHMPELDNDFAKSLGDYETMDDLISSLRSSMEAQKNQEYDRDYFNELVDMIAEGATVKYPPQMLEEEEEQVKHSIEHNLADQGLDLPTYLKIMQTDEAAFVEKEVRPAAQKRIARSLVLDEIARQEKIQLADGELQSSFNETISELSQERLQELQRSMSSRQLADALAYEAASRAMSRRVMRRLKAIATGKGDEPEEEETQDVTEIQPVESEILEAPVAEETAPEATAVETVETTETPEDAGSQPTSTEEPSTPAPEA